MADRYNVPNLVAGKIHRAEETIHRSRFIVTIARVSSPEETKAFIESVRQEHSQATHNCWAYVAGEPGSTAQVGASDDGEPKGTAGRPHAYRSSALRSRRDCRCRYPILRRYFIRNRWSGSGLSRFSEVRLGNPNHITERVPCDRIKFTLEHSFVNIALREFEKPSSEHS